MNGSVKMGRPGPPSGIYMTAWEWATAFVQHGGDVGHYYRMISDLDHSIIQHGPHGMDHQLYMSMFQYHLSNLNPDKYVAIIPNGRTYAGAVISPDNRLIWDVSMDFFGTPQTHAVFSHQALPEATYVQGTAAVLTTPGSGNYYHWLLDTIPRIELLRRSGIAVDKYILHFPGTISFQTEILALLGISPHQVIDSSHGTHYQVEAMVVPAMVSTRSLLPKWPIEFLRRELLLNRGMPPSVNGGERIYVSRRYATHRRIRNEQAVTTIMENCGFRTVFLEQLSVVEAAHMFSSSKVVVGAHGAGLANLLFCTPGTKVLELFAPRCVNLCYWVISNHAGLNYHYLLG
jgi:capsular polysaccharide biosynthesis protein